MEPQSVAELSPWVVLGGAALVGTGLGFGLVIGAFVARSLRRYMAREDLEPYRKPPDESSR